MKWWNIDTPTGALAAGTCIDTPIAPLDIRHTIAADLDNMLRTTRLKYPSGCNYHGSPVDRTFADVAVVALVTALIYQELDLNEASSLDKIHSRLVAARSKSRPDFDLAAIETRARKLVIDAAAEMYCAARLAHPALTDGARYDIRTDLKGVDIVVRFKCAGARSVQIKRGLGAVASTWGSLFAIPMDLGDRLGPAVVASTMLTREFVEKTELVYAPDRFSGQQSMFDLLERQR